MKLIFKLKKKIQNKILKNYSHIIQYRNLQT